MKYLQEYRMKRNKARLGEIPDRSDEALDDVEQKIVPVEWFDSLEGIDEGVLDGSELGISDGIELGLERTKIDIRCLASTTSSGSYGCS